MIPSQPACSLDVMAVPYELATAWSAWMIFRLQRSGLTAFSTPFWNSSVYWFPFWTKQTCLPAGAGFFRVNVPPSDVGAVSPNVLSTGTTPAGSGGSLTVAGAAAPSPPPEPADEIPQAAASTATANTTAPLAPRAGTGLPSPKFDLLTSDFSLFRGRVPGVFRSGYGRDSGRLRQVARGRNVRFPPPGKQRASHSVVAPQRPPAFPTRRKASLAGRVRPLVAKGRSRGRSVAAGRKPRSVPGGVQCHPCSSC